MDSWDEIRTAYQVARAGTVSGAAEALGVHHATVIRHIDALEGRLGVKLFQRHARGYTPTEAGADLMQIAQATDDQFLQLEGRIKGQGQGVSGELVVTALSAHAAVIAPLLTEFQANNPGLKIKLVTGARILRLEYGEAHVAIRAGAAPTEPDNVVQALCEVPTVLAGTRGYLAAHGTPQTPEDFAKHTYVGTADDDGPAPFNRWINALAGPDRIGFRVAQEHVMLDAIRAGAGLGIVGRWQVKAAPELVEVLADPGWIAPLWLVTHVDLHRTAKVQAFLTFLKENSDAWTA